MVILSHNISFQVKLKANQVKPNHKNDPFYDIAQTRATMGHHAWLYIHSVAAAYPDEPTEEDKSGLLDLVNSIEKIFPCEECKGHFKDMIAQNPLVDSSKKDVIYYFCGLHNKVNIRLEKREFDCDEAYNYWKNEGCGCTGNNEESLDDDSGSSTSEA